MAGVLDIELPHTFDEVFSGGHIAHGAERIDIDTHRMDDVVDSMLDDHIACTRHIHLDRETCLALQSVSLIGDAIVLTQDARTAHRTTDDGHIVQTFLPRTVSQVVGPALRSYRIAIAHQRMVLLFGQNIDGVEEIEPVGVPGQVERQHLGIGIVAIRELALRERSCHQCTCIHLRIAAQINAYLDGISGIYCQRYLIALNLFAWRNVDTPGPIESDGYRTIMLHHFRHTHLGECHLFSTRQVREAETQLASTEAHPNGIPQRDVPRIHRHLAVGDRRGVAPACHPLGIFICLFLHRYYFSVQS